MTLIHDHEILIDKEDAKEWLIRGLKEALQDIEDGKEVVSVSLCGVEVTADFEDESVSVYA